MNAIYHDIDFCQEEMIQSPGDGANDIIEALKKNTHRIEEKSRVLYAEYIEFLQKKDKSLSEELALLRSQSDKNIKER